MVLRTVNNAHTFLHVRGVHDLPMAAMSTLRDTQHCQHATKVNGIANSNVDVVMSLMSLPLICPLAIEHKDVSVVLCMVEGIDLWTLQELSPKSAA